MTSGETHQTPPTVAELFELLRGRRVKLLANRGNAGDALIARGCRELAASKSLTLEEFAFPQDACGNILLVQGNGNLCGAFHTILPALRQYIPSFSRVFILPSSLDPACAAVGEWLRELPAHVTLFCRERHSYDRVRAAAPHVGLVLDHDLAFHVDFRRWQRPGSGNLNAFRTDSEGVGGYIPDDNFDISVLGTQADVDLLPDLLADYASVRTDRAHVAIVAALLRKETHLYPSNYHKLRGMYEFSLSRFSHVTFHEDPAEAASWCAAHPGEVEQSAARRDAIVRLLEYTPRSRRPATLDKAFQVPA